MSFCFNPDCRRPLNPAKTKYCQTCGSPLLLQKRYRALKLIGQGGFGRTFLAVDEDEPTKPRCVIKQFFPQAQGTHNAEKAAELFAREALRLEELGKHPQIPQFLAHFEEDERQYLVQEFINGQNLARVLKAEGAFNETQIRDLLNSLLPIIQFIHDRNVIHRDIKPENIIRRASSLTPPRTKAFPHIPPLTRGGEGGNGGVPGKWVLVDFGAAKYATGTALVRTGTVIGSAGYVAPEQAGGKARFASDLYSLGVTCIHLLTQMEPFDLYSFSDAAWVWRDYLNRPVSARLGRVLDGMLETATSRRYQSASEVLNALNSPMLEVTPAIESSRSDFDAIAPPMPTQTQNWQCIRTLQGHTGPIRSLAISPDGEILASGSDDKTIKLWYLATGDEVCTIRAHSQSVCSVVISPDGQMLASGSDDKTIKLWQLSTGKQLGTLTPGNWFLGYSGCVYSLAISPDGKLLASLSSAGTIKLWQLSTGKELRAIADRSCWVHAIAFSPDGQVLAGGSDDQTIKLWQVSTGRRMRSLKGHNSWVLAVAFSPDGQMLASGSDDTTVKLWDLRSGQKLYALTSHQKDVHTVAFSPDGQTLVSGSGDRTLKLWQVSTGQELCTLVGHESWVHTVTFSPDGQVLISGSGDSTIKIWQRNLQ